MSHEKDHITASTRASQVLAFVSEYFERMPPVSRVTFDELVPYVCKECNHDSPSAVRSYIHEVLKDRTDFVINRGRGICKIIPIKKEFDVEGFMKDSEPPPPKE